LKVVEIWRRGIVRDEKRRPADTECRQAFKHPSPIERDLLFCQPLPPPVPSFLEPSRSDGGKEEGE